jgi:hypothetical protein
LEPVGEGSGGLDEPRKSERKKCEGTGGQDLEGYTDGEGSGFGKSVDLGCGGALCVYESPGTKVNNNCSTYRHRHNYYDSLEVNQEFTFEQRFELDMLNLPISFQGDGKSLLVDHKGNFIGDSLLKTDSKFNPYDSMNLKITNGFNVLNENTGHFTNQKKDTCEYSLTVKEDTQVSFDGEPSNIKNNFEVMNSEKNGTVDGNQQILEKLKSNGTMSLNQFEKVKDILDFVDNSNFVIDYNTRQVNFLSDGIPKEDDRSRTPKMEGSESEGESDDPYLEMEKKFKIIQSQ